MDDYTKRRISNLSASHQKAMDAKNYQEALKYQEEFDELRRQEEPEPTSLHSFVTTFASLGGGPVVGGLVALLG
ncbi:MAG: hypothetical protein KAS32_02760, partial [Candidatus Peribacteraceae bacterium]|nr:hypothetical protein [Candidatus Peribacteraceae bacterium]